MGPSGLGLIGVWLCSYVHHTVLLPLFWTLWCPYLPLSRNQLPSSRAQPHSSLCTWIYLPVLPSPLWSFEQLLHNTVDFPPSQGSCSVVFDSANRWTVAYPASPSMEFSRQEYWSGLPFPSPRDLPDPGIEPRSPTLQAGALPSKPPGKPSPFSGFIICHWYSNILASTTVSSSFPL